MSLGGETGGPWLTEELLVTEGLRVAVSSDSVSSWIVDDRDLLLEVRRDSSQRAVQHIRRSSSAGRARGASAGGAVMGIDCWELVAILEHHILAIGGEGVVSTRRCMKVSLCRLLH